MWVKPAIYHDDIEVANSIWDSCRTADGLGLVAVQKYLAAQNPAHRDMIECAFPHLMPYLSMTL